MKNEILDDLEKNIGRKVREIRTFTGFSQTEVAEALGITFQQVQKYEKGTNRISPGKLILLAHFFKVPVSQFFDLTNENAPLLSADEVEVLRAFKSIKSSKLREKALQMCKLLNDLDEDI